MIKVAILTISDRCARGERQDDSGPAIEQMLPGDEFEVCEASVLPDQQEEIVRELVRICDRGGCDVVFTTGGTGLGPRDVTPEATISVCERLVPGFGELMRAQGLKKTRYAVLSRATAGLRAKTLVINLPGSPKAVRECLEAVLDLLPHAVKMLHGGGHEENEA